MRPRVRVCLCVLSHCAQVSEGVSSCERAIARVAGALRGRERAEGERELNAPSRAGRGGPAQHCVRAGESGACVGMKMSVQMRAGLRRDALPLCR
jgi:hypothetical protein